MMKSIHNVLSLADQAMDRFDRGETEWPEAHSLLSACDQAASDAEYNIPQRELEHIRVLRERYDRIHTVQHSL